RLVRIWKLGWKGRWKEATHAGHGQIGGSLGVMDGGWDKRLDSGLLEMETNSCRSGVPAGDFDRMDDTMKL
ncbi:hypothetical protein ACLOJK_006579, partial [Asimina triloba]